MRHPANQPKYRINQIVKAPLCSVAVVIKSIRYEGQSEWKSNRQKFTTLGWEYQAFYYSLSYKGWLEWGWLVEKELDSLND